MTPGFTLTAEPVTSPAKMWDKNSTLRVVSVLADVANGVLSMSRNVPGLVGYSRSLGVVRTEGDRVSLVFSARSATESQLDASEDELSALGALAGAEVSHYSRYPGWDFAENSPSATRGLPHTSVFSARSRRSPLSMRDWSAESFPRTCPSLT